MVEKGYAETSLTDLAGGADMSVSHFLYYYPSKEAALLEMCDEIFARLLADVTAFKGSDPEHRIQNLVDNLFVRGAMSRSELGILRQMNALAMHRPQLRRRFRALDREMHAYLEDLFQQVPRQSGLSASDAAELAGAIWAGLVINIDFDERLDDRKARRLFHRSLLTLAGLSASAIPRARRSGKPKKALATFVH